MSSEATEQQNHEAEQTQTRRPPAQERLPQVAPGGEFDSPVERLASGIGNKNFTQVVARMADGEGILQGGRVHPDVEAAIAASKGGGHSLDRSLGATLSSSYGDDLGDVRVHTDSHAQSLARAVSARAFTVGNDIFFNSGEYSPTSGEGKQLIAHEVAHVVQQRGAPAAGPLTVTTPGDAFERDAETAARDAFA